MKNKTHMPVLREIFQKIILIVGEVLLCILFVAITAVWLLTDYIFRKLEREVLVDKGWDLPRM